MDIRKTQALRDILKDKSLLKDKCYIDGKWVGGSATIDVTNPVDESVIGTVPKLGAAETRSRHRGRPARPEGLGEEDRQGARRHPAQVVQPDDGEPGGPGPDHDRRAGQAAGRIARRGRLWRLLHRVLRRRGQAHLWRDHSVALAQRPHDRDQAAGGRRGGHHAVELPQCHDHPQGRPGAGRRLRLRLQARQRDAALGAGPRRTGRARRHSGGRLLRHHRRPRARSARR